MRQGTTIGPLKKRCSGCRHRLDATAAAVGPAIRARWVWPGQAADLPARLERPGRGAGLDAVVLTVPSNDLVAAALDAARGAGKVPLFAHTRRGDIAGLDLSKVCVDEKDLLGSYSCDVTLQAQVARLVFGRRLDVRRLITHEYPLEQTSAAVKLAAQPTPTSLKIVVNPAANRVDSATSLD